MCKEGSAQKISEALAKGADVNAKVFVNKYEQDVTPLMAAARDNSVEAVNVLIKAGADVNARRKDGISALGLAAAFNTPDVVEALLKAGAKNKEAPLVQFNNLSAKNVAVLLKYGTNPNVRLGANGLTALMSVLNAANSSNERNTVETAKMLINAGADINAKSSGGYTALWFAARRSLVEIVKLLIKNGADVNASAESVTVLDTSAMYSTPETVKILIDSGADVNGNDSMTPLMLAMLNSSYPEEMINIFLDAGADVNAVYDKKRAVDYARKRKVLQGTSALKRLEAASR